MGGGEWVGREGEMRKEKRKKERKRKEMREKSCSSFVRVRNLEFIPFADSRFSSTFSRNLIVFSIFSFYGTNFKLLSPYFEINELKNLKLTL